MISTRLTMTTTHYDQPTSDINTDELSVDSLDSLKVKLGKRKRWYTKCSTHMKAILDISTATDNIMNKIIALCIIAILLLHIGIRLGSSIIVFSFDSNGQYNGGTYLRSIINSDKPFEEKNIPTCAQDVIITLHKTKEEKGSSNKKEHTCRGILIRDDIIITSSGCSEYKFTFDFPGSGGDKVEAVPHPSLNSKKEMKKSHLGFLEANPPYHYQFYDKPVRRNRVFLSRQSDTISHTDKSVVIECDNEGRPILHNFPVKKGKKHEMIPINQLDGVVPDDILWEDVDRMNTVKSTQNNSTWWNRKITLEEGDFTFDRFEEYRGLPGGLSIRESDLMEAVDPRGHRRAYCYTKDWLKEQLMFNGTDCYDRWREEKPFSGQHFFEWLDFGSTCLEDKSKEWEDHEKKWKCKSYPFLNREQRLQHEVYITPSEDNQKLVARFKHNDEFVPESGDYPVGPPHTYVWGLDEVFRIAPAMCKSYDKKCVKGKKVIKHMVLFSGKPALGAGEIYVGKNGTIWGINFKSGHYFPDIKSVTIMYQWVKDNNFNTSTLNWIGRNYTEPEPGMWSEEECGERTTIESIKTVGYNALEWPDVFDRETKWDQWEGIEIPGFNATTLEKTCREVTNSPTWMVGFNEDDKVCNGQMMPRAQAEILCPKE